MRPAWTCCGLRPRERAQAGDDSRVVTLALVRTSMREHVEKLSGRVPQQQLALAAQLYDEMIDSPDFAEFLTLRAYEYLD